MSKLETYGILHNIDIRGMIECLKLYSDFFICSREFYNTKLIHYMKDREIVCLDYDTIDYLGQLEKCLSQL